MSHSVYNGCFYSKFTKNSLMANALKILVLSEAYPSKSGQAMAFVHSRNQYYLKQGHEVVVLSFKAKTAYLIDGVSVVSMPEFSLKYRVQDFDVVVSHAPNLKNHFRFLLSHYSKITQLVFFFHGHEVLIKSKYYPKPFKHLSKDSALTEFMNDVYDGLKVRVLKVLFKLFMKKSKLVFVSDWMRTEFIRNVKIDSSEVNEKSYLIANAVNPVFEIQSYDLASVKKNDFVTLRQFDGSKYAIDLVVQAALDNPDFEFHVYGQGGYFDHYEQPANLKVFKKSFRQDEIPHLLNQYKAAIMPTRLDAQGVMVCEMATYGIPVVTSDIAICREVLSGFENVLFLPNSAFKFEAKSFLAAIKKDHVNPNKKFFSENTIAKELTLFKEGL